TNYDYDSSGRLASIANLAFANSGHTTGTTGITYNSDNTVNTVSRPNGHRTNYFYNDPRGRLSEIDQISGNAAVRSEVYAYNDVDDLIQRNVSNGSIFTYTYDEIHQLKSESVPALGTHYA